MRVIRRRRLYKILYLLIGSSIFLSLLLSALQSNIHLYYFPHQLVLQASAQPGEFVRVGGVVSMNSLHYTQGTKINFRIQDETAEMTVEYDGLLPDLFREGQAVVVEGYWRPPKQLNATSVLAKHDENYSPLEPE